jgi:hypothetical protein
MTKEDYIKYQETKKSRITKAIVFSLLAITFIIGWFLLFSFLLDTFFPNRAEEKMPFFTSFLMQTMMIAPLIIFIGIGLKQFMGLSDYFASSRVRKPVNYNSQLLSLDTIKSRIESEKFDEIKEFTYPSLLLSAYKKRKGVTKNDTYILFFSYDFFNVNDLDKAKQDLDQKYLNDNHFTCFIFVISEESDNATKDYLRYDIETCDSRFNISLYENSSNQFYFKHPFVSGKNDGTAKINDYNPIYDIFIGQSFKTIPKIK